MAETKVKSKTKAKAKSSKAKKAATRKASNGKANGANAATKSSSPKSGSSSGNGSGNGIGAMVEKAKLPLIATGAVAAGAAAVLVGKNGHHKQRKVLGVPVPKRSKVHMPKVGLPKGKDLKGDVRRAAGAVGDAAKQADEIGRRISKVANSVQMVSETTDKAAKKS